MKQSKTLRRMILTALFAAIIIVMAVTPLGYLRIGTISITLLPIPVSIAAIVLGPATGAVMGGIFGLTSLVQCFGMDAFGTMLMGINPIYTLIVVLVPRVLCGWLTGVIFNAVNRSDKSKWIGYIVAGFSTAALNTLVFLSLLYLLFAGNADFIAAYGTHTIITIFVVMAGVNGIVEILSCTIVSPTVSKALAKYARKKNII